MIGLVNPVVAAPRFETDVHVDVIAKTVTEAKKKAMAKAVRDGINEVVLRISTNKSVEEINKLTDNQLEHFITGIMVLMEKTSDVRYMADLRISVDGDILRAYLKENDLPLVFAEEKNILAIPVMEDKEGNLDLWGDENSWQKMFREYGSLHKGRINIIIIDKNLGNISMVKVNRLFELTDAEYKELASFNHVDGIYVLKYSQKDEKIYIKKYPEQENQEVMAKEGLSKVLIDKVLPYFKDDEDMVQLSGKDEKESVFEKIEIVYTYSKLSEWMSLKQVLENNVQVQDIKIISMVNGKVHFNFIYSGVIEKLQGTLAMNGYKMQKEGEHYVIY